MTGEEEVAEEKVLFGQRQSTVDSLRKLYAEKGEDGQSSGLSKEESQALDIWAATGQFPPAGMFHGKRHPITIEDPSGSGQLLPAMEEEDGTVWANGQQVANPRIMPKWKPRKAVMRDAGGKFFSVNLDPVTNQPIPGTENYSELPPASYLEKIRDRQQLLTNDSGEVSIATLSTRSYVNVPANAVDGKLPAVPPPMRKLPPAVKSKAGAGAGKGAGAGAGTSSSRITPTGYTKDTGVLSPVAQRTLIQTEPVVNQARKLEQIFEDHPELKTNDTPGYLLLPYIAYRLGYATDGALEEEIAGLSLGSVIEAASALQGTSRSISALRLAMIHTPNAKLDSPEQIYRKLHNDIIPRLDEIVDAAHKYGRKRATSDYGPNSAPAAVQSPPTKSDADQAAEKWLQEHP